ncbi:MAG TPA: ArgE/DapE family deacylase [Longimicrobiales bacterium]|nr:ArgE/DapE family deacylase [Longimicrobiales bacterium]
MRPPESTLDLTRALVSVPSVNPDLERGGGGEREIADLCAGWLRAWAFDVEQVDAAPGRTSVLARARLGTGPVLILNGHLDTVGVDGMTVDPFAAEIRNGRLYGRGACDMKAGIAALLAATRDAVHTRSFSGELVVALVADEENASIGLQALLDRGLTGDAAIVCEPTGLAVMPAHKGFVWLGLEFRGRAAHGSRPDLGVDAVRHAGLLLARLGALAADLQRRRAHPLLGHGSIHAGTIAGGTAASVYPASCRLTVERRTLPGETAAEVRREMEVLLERIRDDVPELAATVRIALERPGTEVPADAPVVRALQAALRRAGVEPRLEGMSAWVDAALLNGAGTPAVCFGPGGIEQAHADDESVPVDQLDVARHAIAGVIERLLPRGRP